jgi:hypothetical protein
VLSRRRFLCGSATAGAAAALSGCASAATDPAADVAPRSTGIGAAAPGAASSTDVRLVESAIVHEEALLVLYAAAGRAQRPLQKPLDRLVAQQDQHIATLRAALTDPEPRPRRRRRRLSGSQDVVVEKVRRGVADAQSARRADALAAQSGPLARLLASMSASHAVAASLDALQP